MSLIYHYCSPYTFLQILERKRIWLSSTSNMNDSAECEWFIDAVKDVLDQNVTLLGSDWCQTASIYIKNNFQPKYVACFSKDGDSLSQWRAYADNGEGLAIGFERDELNFDKKSLTPTVSESEKIEIDDIKYIEKEDIRKFILEKMMEIREHYKGNDVIDPRLKNELRGVYPEICSVSAIMFVRVIINLAASVKNPAFSEEKEVRIVHSPFIEYLNNGQKVKTINAIGEIKHRISNGYLTSHFEYGFDSTVVKEIVMGPRNKFLDMDLKIFLTLNGMPSAMIKRSAATYR
ncbi:hypothetical protein SERVES_03128 [Serratia ficaria]|uniref:DUF2971 domain-containing protein n=1 Tax=Serratia ficaria TaxID=61651 RepID=UPI00119BFEFE|nr:DUF2971 domain-containing protein [Serratia ficaria]VVA49372.1 hypothetical protein SERVES_03128 [Serratia ficaria]